MKITCSKCGVKTKEYYYIPTEVMGQKVAICRKCYEKYLQEGI